MLKSLLAQSNPVPNESVSSVGSSSLRSFDVRRQAMMLQAPTNFGLSLKSEGFYGSKDTPLEQLALSLPLQTLSPITPAFTRTKSKPMLVHLAKELDDQHRAPSTTSEDLEDDTQSRLPSEEILFIMDDLDLDLTADDELARKSRHSINYTSGQ